MKTAGPCLCLPWKGPYAAGTGHNEDRWTDIAPAVRLVGVLSESTGARKLTASVVGRIMLAAGASSLPYWSYEGYSLVHWMLGATDARLLYSAH
jgi:hypothetical protein